MESARTRDVAAKLHMEEVFRPWRNEAAYVALLVVLAGLLAGLWYVESHQVLESQIALGVDPDQVVKFVSAAIVAATLIMTFSALRARRYLLATGELRLSEFTIIVSTASSSMTRKIGELQQISCYPSGAGVRMLFRDDTVRLIGQWLPPGWRPTWRGWRTPSGSVVRVSARAHPLLAALRARRPDLKPGRVGIAGIVVANLLIGILAVLGAEIGSYPLFAAARRVARQQRIHDVARKAFQAGRYLEVCEEYRRALPDLRHDLYGSVDAADSLLYCGDRKSALKAAVGYDLQPLWPVAMDPEVLARIRISSGSYSEAQRLLRGRPGLLLYVALAEQGWRAEADQILERLEPNKGMAHVLHLRRNDRQEEAREAAGTLCAALSQHRPALASVLARTFESCMLGRSPKALAEDPRFETAIRALPGLRAELIQFTKREAPELEADLLAVLALIRSRPRGRSVSGRRDEQARLVEDSQRPIIYIM